jgi:anti-sigma regulatory factor (Ser/Thr protein kinase)/GAF domain-containing protein
MTARGARASDRPGPIDGLQRGSASSRRRLVAGASVAVLLLAAISIALAWRQYEDGRSRALRDLQDRVVAAAGTVETSFTGQIGALDAIAASPTVVAGNAARMQGYFRRLDTPGSTPFTGGIGWIDRTGRVRATSQGGDASPLSLAGRKYFQRVLATRTPYVSGGLIGRGSGKPIVVVAVPTFGHGGAVSGVLIGSILLQTVGQGKLAIDLGYRDVQVIDRNGRLLLGGLAPVENRALLTRMRRLRTGVLPSTSGFDGRGDDVVAFATSKVPGWVAAVDRPRSDVFATARRALLLELGSVLAGVLLVALILVFVTRRARRDTEAQNERARSWTGLTQALASATTPRQVTDALLASLKTAFPNAVAIVGLEHRGRVQVRAASELKRAGRIVQSATTLETIAPLVKDGPSTVALEREPGLRDLYATSGKRLKAVHGVPIVGGDPGPAGTITLLSTARRLEPSEWALLLSFADQAGHALARTWLFVHEHELAVRLQRNLLPDRLPSADGLELAGHYLAGGEGVEVGGDWYDAVRRPDGITHLCVGDVSGKGIGAATVMSRLRHTFGVYAHDFASPAAIIRRMLRHAGSEEMVTVAVVSLDPYAGELVYSSAGHPPALLLDRATRTVMRLDGASAPPVGVAGPADVVEAKVSLPDRALLVLYTDGLIERRGQNIDDAIDFLAELVAGEPEVTPDLILTRVSEVLGAPDDDVALLVASLDVSRLAFEVELPAEPAQLRQMRQRLHTWLAARGFDRDRAADVVLAVSEACNNAIEHAYRDNGGGSIVVRLGGDLSTLSVQVEDQGTWRDEEPDDGRGRGIRIIERLMASANVETGLHGTRVTFEHRDDGRPAVPDQATTGR